MANKREGRAVAQGDVVVGQLEEQGTWVAEGHVEEVCTGDQCFVVLWQKVYGLNRMSRRQHVRIAWEPTRLGPGVGDHTEKDMQQPGAAPEGGGTCQDKNPV